MSLPSPTISPSEPKPNSALHLKEAALAPPPPPPPPSSSPSPSPSSWNNKLSRHGNKPFPPHKRSKVEESDEDMFTVPDVEATENAHCGGTVSNGNMKQSNVNVTVTDPQFQSGFQGKRRRGRNPADKECRRLKRLLRNRVSAQQARERKKVYMNELESRAQELQDKNSKLEERISTLINENTMLRKVLMNTRPKADESNEPKQDQLSKN